MTRPRFDHSRDERVVEEVQKDRALMCAAQSCPNRWSVDAGHGRLCSAHAWSDPHRWPQITEEQLAAVIARARAAAEPARQVAPVSRQTKRAILGRLSRTQVGGTAGKAWAEALRDREARGEKLTRTQRDMWRAALGSRHERMPSPQVEHPPLPIEEAAAVPDDVPAWADEDIPYDDEVPA